MPNRTDTSVVPPVLMWFAPRMDEIFRLVKNEFRKSDYPGDYTFGIVLTGGGSGLEHVTDLAQEIFQQPIKVGQFHLLNQICNPYLLKC